mmetsp:Transcript_13888/g.22672  ORF Transcript_13888/g.22672 Transcript_13888/m.22672 type:complete len:554 (+) Transcript_13888:140-1801(+)|eukprot:CAMPEP_0203753836 /NCGR_PEP_ID=MMETSP0098-20131031/7540_1 /ASSEMBLY_ACC=CAM_ASM_000208 /TAXON_ID=96639 /ORGANISM=" , Strain NY0313808BC1" /LENGTH=553 /DNA_ID=CAMNT_0050644609 /DNA_START=104 /DNA_END=1765 /DNA_ORIENTATION=+
MDIILPQNERSRGGRGRLRSRERLSAVEPDDSALFDGSQEFTFSESESVMKSIKGGHRFRLKQFPSYPSTPGSSISSKRFEVAGHEWQVVCYPGGETEGVEGFLSLFIGYRGPEAECNASWLIRCVRNSDVSSSRQKHWSKGDKYNNFQVGRRWGWPRFLKRECVINPDRGYLQDDTLTIEVELIVHGQAETVSVGPRPCLQRPQIPPSTLGEDLLGLLESGDHTDVSFVLDKGTTTIHAHSQILVARSPVMARMFSGYFVENRGISSSSTGHKNKSSIEISDISGAVFEELIRYTYSGKLDLKKLATRLKDAAPGTETALVPVASSSSKKRKSSFSKGSKKRKRSASTSECEEHDFSEEESPKCTEAVTPPPEQVFVAELLQVADKYEVNTLRLTCEYFLCNCIDQNNVTHFLDLADRHNAEYLKEDCMNFLISNPLVELSPVQLEDLDKSLLVSITSRLLSGSKDSTSSTTPGNDFDISPSMIVSPLSTDFLKATFAGCTSSEARSKIVDRISNCSTNLVRYELVKRGLSSTGPYPQLVARLVDKIMSLDG